ncbi:MAG: cation transporter, partial [Aurantimonas coralicida]|nr:cation transporter [Aurantimonas coralicida]
MASVAVAVIVLAIKYAAYRMTGSVALFSDALESIVNVVAGLIALWAVTLSYKPADSDHPIGHTKADYLSAVIEGVLIVLAALLILREAWQAY